ncbi:MAG: hypothetical protein IKF31_10440 [Clostridiales bacterium]|nr:hypothetical protein [Clostridiales bacterium]
MITDRYEFAGKTVEVNSLHEAVHRYCAAYRTDAPADFSVTISQEDIEYERAREETPGHADAYLEELAVYRKVSEKMPYYDTILFHGSVIAVDGAAYVFTAKSGTGKSTHTALWRRLFGDRAVMVNDDKPLLHVGDVVTAYGTPYDGKHKLSNKIAVPLKAVCILERAEENSIVKITRSEAYPMLVQQAYRPADIAAMQKTLSLIDKMADSVELYRLGCNMDPDAARVAYEGMNR